MRGKRENITVSRAGKGALREGEGAGHATKTTTIPTTTSAFKTQNNPHMFLCECVVIVPALLHVFFATSGVNAQPHVLESPLLARFPSINCRRYVGTSGSHSFLFYGNPKHDSSCICCIPPFSTFLCFYDRHHAKIRLRQTR